MAIKTYSSPVSKKKYRKYAMGSVVGPAINSFVSVAGLKFIPEEILVYYENGNGYDYFLGSGQLTLRGQWILSATQTTPAGSTTGTTKPSSGMFYIRQGNALSYPDGTVHKWIAFGN